MSQLENIYIFKTNYLIQDHHAIFNATRVCHSPIRTIGNNYNRYIICQMRSQIDVMIRLMNETLELSIVRQYVSL